MATGQTTAAPPEENLLIFGASVRAAAYSALRAGLKPWCADLFADADLRAVCPAMRLPGHYPDAFAELVRGELTGPWMYTGGLENHLGLIERMAKDRFLWGNTHDKLLTVRHPGRLARLFDDARLPRLRVYWGDRQPDPGYRCLVKPLRSSGGAGIRFWDGSEWNPASCYTQAYVAGESLSAVYVGNTKTARLLGVTRQLVGADWLHAGPFRYCGSIGAVELPRIVTDQLTEVGHALGSAARLDGLFGVDGVLRDDVFWPVEVNPRYTASIEVLEHATGLQALAWHRYIYVSSAPKPPPVAPADSVVGKAILFAREAVTIPADAPWRESLTAPSIDEMPPFADLPVPGERIAAGRPILTLFARAKTMEACELELRRIAGDLDRWLHGR